MARPRLSRKGQPLWLYWTLRIYEFLASLKLAVILILLLAIVLALATFIESNFGASGVQWYVYHSWWFILLQAMLAVNIFCAAAIRYPWKRHQTGFVITHIGLLTLMAGSAVSYRNNLNSSMLVYKGGVTQIAVDTDQTFVTLENIPGRAEPVQFKFHSGPFNWGEQPFKQVLADQLDRWDWTYKLSKSLGMNKIGRKVEHPPEMVYEDDRTRVEIIDFYSRGVSRSIPYVGLTFINPMINQETEIHLEYHTFNVGDRSVGFTEKDFFGNFGTVLFWRTDDPAEVKGFLNCIPNPSQPVTPDGDGQIVVWSKGEAISFSVKALREAPRQTPDGRTVRLVNYTGNRILPYLPATMEAYPFMLGVDGRTISLGPWAKVEIQEEEDSEPLTVEVFARYPALVSNLRDDLRVELYHPDTKGRVEILEGPENSLYYRVWQQKQGLIVSQGDLKVYFDRNQGIYRSNELVTTWSMGGQMANGEVAAWQMYVNRYQPEVPLQETELVESENPVVFPSRNVTQTMTVRRNRLPLPLPFDKDDPSGGLTKFAKFRISSREAASEDWEEVDTFWLPVNITMPMLEDNGNKIQLTDMPGQEQPMQTSFNVKTNDVGFAVKLVDFDLDVDPGTTMASNYTSQIVQIDVRKEKRIVELQEKVDRAKNANEREEARLELNATRNRLISEYVSRLEGLSVAESKRLAEREESLEYHIITMNEPLDYPDLSGRTLRFFQENYIAPDESGPNPKPMGSVFRVNYDPGRPVKYLGSLLICVGIFVMFYMRAYFFKSIRKRSSVLEVEEKPVPARK